LVTTLPQKAGVEEAVSQSQLRATLDGVVVETLRTVLPGLVILQLVTSALHVGQAACPAAAALSWTSALLCVANFSVWVALYRNRIPIEWAQPVGSVVAVVTLINLLLHLYLVSEPRQSPILTLLLIAIGCIVIAVRWPVLVLLGCLAGWGALTLMIVPWFERLPSGFELLGATIVVVAVCNSRLRTSRQLQEEERRRREVTASEERMALAVRGEMDGLWDWDLKTDTLYFSPRWKSMLGYDDSEIGHSPDDWFNRVHPHDLNEMMIDLSAHLNGQTDHFEKEHRIRQKEGTYRWVLSRGLAVRDNREKAVRIVGSQIDITQLKSFESRLLHDAFHDRLTGLPNRDSLMARLEEVMEARKRNPRYLFAVLFLDLDRFKVINDSLGHHIGDELLAAVAERLAGFDREGDMISRLGGDEFVILLAGLQTQDEATQIANRIQEALAAPFQLVRHEVVTTASIGIALSTTHFERPEDLLRNADIAMYHAKGRGQGQNQVFNSAMHVRTVRLWTLQNDLRHALERQELVMHYQPLISLESGRISGAEVLIRWQRSTGELVSPAEFIPLAEELGLIVDIGEWVLRAACTQNKRWQEAGFRPIRISVNLSARQLRQKDFPATVKRILQETGLEPQWLELELTESALMDTAEVTPAGLHALSCMGVRTSIDDFGTGYSSLTYLRRLKFNTLKIDRSFVAGITTDENAAALAKGMITLAHNLNLNVVAEGVETLAQLSFLHWHGCDQIQGFLASRPLPLERFADLLEADRRLLQDYFATAPPRPERHEFALPPMGPIAVPAAAENDPSARDLQSLAGKVQSRY
jgi:diguanylate cyclase (GGDEF)-like protein/PAS domain S-box-containing protein